MDNIYRYLLQIINKNKNIILYLTTLNLIVTLYFCYFIMTIEAFIGNRGQV